MSFLDLPRIKPCGRWPLLFFWRHDWSKWQSQGSYQTRSCTLCGWTRRRSTGY